MFERTVPDTTTAPPRVVIVQNNPFVLRAWARNLTDRFDDVRTASTRAEAESALEDSGVAGVLLICGQRLGERDPEGSALIRRWRTQYPHIKHAVLASGAMDLPQQPTGVDAVFDKAAGVDALLELVDAALAQKDAVDPIVVDCEQRET